MEDFITGIGQRMRVHDRAECEGRSCVVHNPSRHSMREFPTYWREDRKLMERICPHGIGHPDPDDLEFKKTYMTPEQLHYESMHGCDGCCSTSKE